MADDSTFGGGFAAFGGGNDASAAPGQGADVPSTPAQSFGSGLRQVFGGPQYTPPDPNASPLDQTADTLQQRIKRANEVATNPLLQFFNPQGVAAARNFVPQATEQLQKIREQQAHMQSGRVQADTLGLNPGEVPDEASMADRVEVAKARALRGDLRVFKGLQAVDPKAAEAIQDQVHEVVAGHLSKAQYAYDKLANMTNQGEYAAAVNSLRKEGALGDLEALGLKVPASFDAFSAAKAREGQALREARIGIDTLRTKLEERNTYQPMEKKEAETYNGRFTTVYGDQITNGTWSRNASSGTRGLVVNGAADPRDLGKSFTFASPEQRKAIEEEFKAAVPKEDLEKYRAFKRTYDLATKDAKGNPVAEGKLNTNPNVQQGVAEGLASMLRGGSGGANVGLLKIELAKRGWAQGAIDGLVSNYAGFMNTLFKDADKPYLSQATQKQIRDVMDVLKTYNDKFLEDRAGNIARRAGALGLDSAALGIGKGESAGAIDDALKAGRDEQIARMMPTHQAIGGGDGVFQLGAQRPGAGAQNAPGAQPVTQLPGAAPVATPVQQAQNPPPPAPTGTPGGSPPPAAPSAPGSAQPTTGPQPGGGNPVVIAGKQVTAALPPGVSANYIPAMQRIESGGEKDPWTAGAKGTSAGGAFQFIKSTWMENKPPGAPDDVRKATPEQQTAALANFTQKNATALDKAGLPVNDLTVYVAHNLGSGGATALLKADPNADARSIVGEEAARNNPKFYRGRPTVATVLQRYQDEMGGDEGPKPKPGSGGAQADAQKGVLSRAADILASSGARMIPGVGTAMAARDAFNSLPESTQNAIKDTATEHAPAIGATAGSVIGSAAGPVGSVAGGAAGGAAGQTLKAYLRGEGQDYGETAKQAALGGVFGVAGLPRGLNMAARTVGAGAVEAGSEAAKGAEGADIADAGMKGAAEAFGGELFGRALGMAGHKVWSMFAPSAKKAVQEAAKQFSGAETVLKTESPKLPGANGAPATANPKYEAAERAKAEAETTLKDAGLKPEEAAYAHKVSTEGVPKNEAQVSRPGTLEKDRVGQAYERLRDEVGARGVGAPKASPALTDGPVAVATAAKMPEAMKNTAERVEMEITAPAKSWQEKWTQLQKTRSELLDLERDAQTSTTAGRTKMAADYRTLADSVRKQQEKVAEYVFGKQDGQKFMAWLKIADQRYARVMEATNNGDLAKAATLKGEAGREAERRFMAFAAHDPQAQEAYRAMRKAAGSGAKTETDVRDLVNAEKIPYLGKVFSIVKMAERLRDYMREAKAGSPVKFGDMLPELEARAAGQRRAARDVGGTIGLHGAVSAADNMAGAQ